jgi:hypothetical protein
MEKGKCPLCFGQCETKSYKDPGGMAYDCPKCLRFAFDCYTNNNVCLFLKSRGDARKALQEYIQRNQIKDKYLPLTWSEIGNVLKKAGVNTEGLFK